MKWRRDLAWITDDTGDVIAVGIILVDETGQRVEAPDVSIREGEHLHLPPSIRLPVVGG